MTKVMIDAADGGQLSAYLAAPEGDEGPGIVVIQEIFGVNKVMRDVCDALAGQGYFAICPDLFWRQEPGVDITDQTKAEWDKAFSLMEAFDIDKGVQDLATTLAHLRENPGCNGRAGAVGFCLGGRLAYLMAARTDVDCSVGYYGVSLETLLDEAGNIGKPLMLHIAEKDKFSSPEARARIEAALGDLPKVTLHSYAGMNHAFARVGGEHYDEEAAGLANQRTADFFKTNLQ